MSVHYAGRYLTVQFLFLTSKLTAQTGQAFIRSQLKIQPLCNKVTYWLNIVDLLVKIYGVRHPVDYRLASAETTVKLQQLEPES